MCRCSRYTNLSELSPVRSGSSGPVKLLFCSCLMSDERKYRTVVFRNWYWQKCLALCHKIRDSQFSKIGKVVDTGRNRPTQLIIVIKKQNA